MKSFTFILYLLVGFPFCSAWGNLAHRTIALLAQKYFTPEASWYTRDLLGKETIDSAAIWADTYKLLPWGRDTASWHFVDALDDPPNSCSVDYHRDCHPNRTCIITATMNMTEKISETTIASRERQKALKFLLHLIGDLHCPLHAESIERGGNDILVLYRGIKTNLHFAWDVLIPRDIAGGEGLNEVETAYAWAERLYNKSTNEYGNAALVGVHGLQDLEQATSTKELLLRWATEANELVCRIVLKDGVEDVRGKELSGEYYQGSVAVVEQQITRAGIRLAMWMNLLAEKEARLKWDKEELR
ncbi:phospholipase C/P1 nuclease [Trematosphaeria pertusa]|uniref:Phospholipase C/P1 nuclease n=1 Tax=Trematosphaeria pertusa TaxID=390896 RepID=A0A6A6I5V9_9PLEO|nr:phospholipase C/P1 nuclease [Trematosphaeria pertusa]KAF2245332.1 phospholipase C/P1 nuclease [Trematosphaeria pertusa]